jgi:transcriptional regulator NrdR family protein
MICPNEHCDSEDIKVAETRKHEARNWVCRRRVCKECEYSWWSNEIPLFELPVSLQ